MWVADMDFKVPQAVIDAEKQYLDMGAFGYYRRDSYFDAFIEWEKSIIIMTSNAGGFALHRA